jgi:hypothetical protein
MFKLIETSCVAVQGTTGSPACTTQLMQQQMQPQQLLQSCRMPADVSDALQAAQGYADPAVRGHLIKELKQKQYKVNLASSEQLSAVGHCLYMAHSFYWNTCCRSHILQPMSAACSQELPNVC